MTTLTAIESDRLAELEGTIERCLQGFHEMGQALTLIRDDKLYLHACDPESGKLYQNFEDYCQGKWGITRQRAYQLMSAARTVGILSTTVDNQPESERQIRGLTSLKPEQQQQAWSAANAVNPQPTHGQVEKAIASVLKPQRFQPGESVLVEDEDCAYAGEVVEVLSCDGVIVKAQTRWGEVVPLLTSEIQPEKTKPAPVKAAPQVDYTAMLQAKWQTEQARSLLLEAELKKLIGMIRGRSSYAELEVAAVCAERLVVVELAA